jgi:adenylate cyclase
MRIGVRTAISGLVLTSILVSAIGVHLLWWKTAEQTSQNLARTINEQIVSAVGKELASIATEAKSAHTAIRTLFLQNVLDTREADKREFVFLSQLQSQPSVSWVAFGWPDGAFFAAHKLGDSGLEMMEIATMDGRLQRRVDQYEMVTGDIQFEKRRFEDTTYSVTDQEWFRRGLQSDDPQWFKVSTHPIGERPSIALAGPIDVYHERQGVLSIIIEYTRLSKFLSQLAVGKSGAAFILDREGAVIAAPDPNADEVNPPKADQPLLPVANGAARQAAGASDTDEGSPYQVRMVQDGEAYSVTLTPLSFPGWSLATVVPESEFLGPVETTIRQLVVGLAAMIAGAGLLSAWLAQRLVAAPLIKVVNEIKYVERFELDQVRRHPSQLTELENLSGAIADMAGGLAAFRKFIPADLVRTLVSEGIEPRPGGAIRPMTVMFADIAGFTGLSERLGDRIIPLLSRYLDAMSAEINSHDGTIDKFIGDAVMAFWGAPAANPDHAVASCRAALACQRAIRSSGIVDDKGKPLRIRIGINTGEMLVGNIGSEVRLNYTVIGDAVNVASRLEGANKQYGTDIIIGYETRRMAGHTIYARELDELAVYGREGGLQVYELLGAVGMDEDPSDWVRPYERGLAAYRGREFERALDCFRQALKLRPQDGPSRTMIERCRQFAKAPPADDWAGLTVAESK